MAKKSGKKNTKGSGKNGKAEDNPNEMRRRQRQPVLVKLGDKEIAGFARDYAGTKQQIDLAKLELKKAQDKFKDDSKLLEEAAGKLLGWIRAEAKEIEMDVDAVYDWAHNEVRVERADTHEVVARRTMTREEAQRELFDVEGKQPPKDRSEVRDAKPGEPTGADKLTAPMGEIHDQAHGDDEDNIDGDAAGDDVAPMPGEEGLSF